MSRTKVRKRGSSVEVSGPGANSLFAALTVGAMKDPDKVRSRLEELGDQNTPYANAMRVELRARLEQLEPTAD